MERNRRKGSYKLNCTERYDIVLWGPTGSGKDYLMNGFFRQAQNFDSEDEYNYKLVYSEGTISTPGSVINKTPHSTEKEEAVWFNFSRELKSSYKNKNPYHHNHYHFARIVNNKGEDLVGATQELIEHKGFRELLKKAKCFILVLDIPSEQDTPMPNKSLVDAWDANRYYENVDMFFKVLEEESKGKRRNIAICMTKADKCVYDGDPWEILAKRYNKDLEKLIRMKKETHNVEVFYISATGFLEESESNSSCPSIKTPINAAMPFFWFFEMIERERLHTKPRWLITDQRLSKKNYIPYPKPITNIRQLRQKMDEKTSKME